MQSHWLPIETAPTEGRKMFIIKAFNQNIGPGILYTSDPYAVWREGEDFVRWPHKFQPTHWLELPESPAA